MRRTVFSIVLLLSGLLGVSAQLPADVAAKIDAAAADVLQRTGVPSASVAVVRDGRIAYVKAYGMARLEPPMLADPKMRYSIGSISKQFTAAALLMLQEDGKLSLDDKVGKYIPDLTRANEVTIRQLLSHTSGYQDYWPQDYVMPGMLRPTNAQQIMNTWAKKPLDFEPGTKWQYSNTNYVIAGVIIEKVGDPLWLFLQQRIFKPLGMTSAYDVDRAKLFANDPTGYYRFALGPLHPAPKEGPGWLFAAGEIAMTAEDLAKWDVSVIQQKLLKPASYHELSTDTLLKNGVASRYGLGETIGSFSGHRMLSHGGEVSGFTAQNVIFPDDGAAVVVLTNQDAADAGGGISNAIIPMLFASGADAATPVKTEQARKIFAGLQKGTIDRSLFTDNANFYFSDVALKDFATSLGGYGDATSFVQVGQSLRGGMTQRTFIARFANGKALRIWTFEMPDGKLEQLQVAGAE